jgi:hypothetical protein
VASAAAFVGKPLDDVGAGQHLAARLDQRLALLLRQQAGDGIGPLAQQRGSPAHHGRALVRRDLAPFVEAALRRGQRAVQVGDAGMRHGADHRAAGGVQHVQGLAAGSGHPFVVDEQLRVGIGSGRGVGHRRAFAGNEKAGSARRRLGLFSYASMHPTGAGVGRGACCARRLTPPRPPLPAAR